MIDDNYMREYQTRNFQLRHYREGSCLNNQLHMISLETDRTDDQIKMGVIRVLFDETAEKMTTGARYSILLHLCHIG